MPSISHQVRWKSEITRLLTVFLTVDHKSRALPRESFIGDLLDYCTDSAYLAIWQGVGLPTFSFAAATLSAGKLMLLTRTGLRQVEQVADGKQIARTRNPQSYRRRVIIRWVWVAYIVDIAYRASQVRRVTDISTRRSP